MIKELKNKHIFHTNILFNEKTYISTKLISLEIILNVYPCHNKIRIKY